MSERANIVDLKNIDYVKGLQQNLRVCFENESGREVMKFIEAIGKWFPNIYDSTEINEIVSRDANRRLIGTIKTALELPPEQIVALAKSQED